MLNKNYFAIMIRSKYDFSSDEIINSKGSQVILKQCVSEQFEHTYISHIYVWGDVIHSISWLLKK